MKNSIRVIIVFGTLALNVLLIYALLYGDSFRQILVDKNQPYKLAPSNYPMSIAILIIITFITLTSIVLLLRIYKKQEIFIYAPLLSLLVLAAIIIAPFFSLKYPGSTSMYLKDGHYYKIEIWWNMPNHIRTYKRWRSVGAYDGKSNADDMIYMLDSLYALKDD